MNLFHMFQRQDPDLRIEGNVLAAERSQDSETWRGLELRAGASFVIPDVRRFVNFRAIPDTCGWMAETPRALALKVSFRPHGAREELTSRRFAGAFQPVLLPWPRKVFGRIDLCVEAVGEGKGGVFLAAHRALSRDWLIELATGIGVEIGPGPQPQILPSDRVRVSYVEQMRPVQWNELYNRSGKHPVRPELWDNYIVGDASDLPVADHSLDFIFGSHVFEHLANPFGHLEAWKRKLAQGGKIICVVPDLGGTKDAVHERSTVEEWLQEYEQQVWDPTERHYVRHLRLPPEHRKVEAAIERKQSIHAHYYDNINAQQLLQFAVDGLGYADYVIEHTRNHKDFHFVLTNG